VVPASLPIRLPAGLPPDRGIFLANLETAVNLLLDAHPRLGERVVVFGQGVVGLLVTQLLRRTGVSQIIAVDPLARRRTLAREVGADLALAPEPDLLRTIRDHTDGTGADLAIEASGNGRALDQAIATVAFQGTVVVGSWYGTKPVSLQLGGAFHRGRLRLVSSQVSTIDPALSPRWHPARRLALARDLLSELQLALLITHRLPFADAAAAYALIDQHPDQTVQVVLNYD
jgi:2-desacetyl-2-hydroxyethyl bacteriochlorophyllide A dehydrogenase